MNLIFIACTLALVESSDQFQDEIKLLKPHRSRNEPWSDMNELARGPMTYGTRWTQTNQSNQSNETKLVVPWSVTAHYPSEGVTSLTKAIAAFASEISCIRNVLHIVCCILYVQLWNNNRNTDQFPKDRTCRVIKYTLAEWNNVCLGK